MKKSKGKQVDLFYSKSDKKQPIKKSKKTNPNKSKNQAKKSKRSNKKNVDNIDLDNEIVIGITPKKERRHKGADSRNKKHAKKIKKVTPKKTQRKVKKEVDIQKRKRKLKILKWTSIITLTLVAIILFMLSSVFNIRKIMVNNNSIISSEEIISLSGIKKDVNMFKISTLEAEDNIKKEPYIASVKIKRNLNGTININIEERKTSYMLAFANSYVYINNQGYMLEISEEKLSVPMLTGFETETKNIEPGERLVEADLLKLGTVIKIMDSAKGNNIAHAITSIDISEDNNYILTIDTEGKTVHFGDSSKINQKIIWIMGCIEQEKGIQGELFLNNVNKPYFREKVDF